MPENEVAGVAEQPQTSTNNECDGRTAQNGPAESAGNPAGCRTAVEHRTAADTAKRQAARNREIFADRLRHFVQNWAPRYSPIERERFQHELMCLFVEAMQNQSAHFTFGVETYVADMFRQQSLAPLQVIMERSKP